MRWRGDGGGASDDVVQGLLDDLEMQAEGLHLAERAVEVGELSIAQYAEIELLARLHASVGSAVRVSIADGMELHGRLAAAGTDWLLVEDECGGAWFAHVPHVVMIGGLAAGSVPDTARSISARLSLRSILRRHAAEGGPCALHLTGGRTLHGSVVRVGADFVELRPGGAPESVTVPLAAVAVIQDRP